MFFHVSPGTGPWKTIKSGKFLGFEEILRENGLIFVKNGPRNLNSPYLWNTLFPKDFDLEVLWSWNLAKLWRKWWKKEIIDRILIFARFSKRRNFSWKKPLKFTHFSRKFSPYWKSGLNQNSLYRTFSPPFTSQLGQISAP